MATAIPKITLSSSRDIPFNRLVLSQSNVRRVKSGLSIGELARDIERRGLLQSLNVRPVLDDTGAETGTYEVPAGGRRFRALELLVKQKKLAKTASVPCVVCEAGSAIFAEDDSLAENVQRVALHPLDQFRAFRDMLEKGMSEEEIAAAFFVAPAVVKQRLRLMVAPVAGLRPSRAATSFTLNLPKFGRVISSPALAAAVMRWKRNRSIVIAAVCVLRRAPCSPCCAGHRRSAARQPAASISCGHPIRVPEGDADRLARGDYLPRGVPLLKPVAAIGGQTVCRTGSHIVVDGLGVGEALTTDHRGRPLPVWQGCHRLDAREIFVMNTHEPRSLDGRYFGPLRVSSVIGRATPLWVAADSVPAAGLSSPRFLQDH